MKPLYNGTPLGRNILSLIATQRLPMYISGRRDMRIGAVEHNVAAFSELSFAVRWQGN